jgi:hypothetical protein
MRQQLVGFIPTDMGIFNCGFAAQHGKPESHDSVRWVDIYSAYPLDSFILPLTPRCGWGLFSSQNQLNRRQRD